LNNQRQRAATLLLCAAAFSLGACSLARRETAPAPHPVVTVPAAAGPAAAPAGSGGAPGAVSGSGAAVAGAAAPAAVRPEVPPAARADFTRAVMLMRAGSTADAERAFRQIAAQYPQFAAPLVNVGLMQRKQGQLEKAEASLKSAVARENGSAVAWTELGVTQRMRGEFKDAAASYQKAVEVDPLYAPAWRNLGVLEDLYLGDPARALPAFEQYKSLTGEEKPVSGWIADLRQRLGMPAVRRPEAAAPAPGSGAPPAAEPGAAVPPPAPEPAPAAAPKTGG
jgi:tetratricopeptide (TPR) repeat protein